MLSIGELFSVVNSDYNMDVLEDVKKWYRRDKILSELLSFGILQDDEPFYDVFDCVIARLCIFFSKVERGSFVEKMIYNFMYEKDEKLFLWNIGEEWIRKRIFGICDQYRKN